MLEKVEVRTDQGELLILPLQDISDGYSIQNIEGLDPVNAIMVSSAFAQMNGEQYQSSRREKRNLVFTLGYHPNFSVGTVQDLRKQLYGIFMPESRLRFRFFHTNEPMVEIYGYVETMDSPKFTKEPTAVISVICFDPDFYDPVKENLYGQSTTTTIETDFEYLGTVESGILFTLEVDRTISDFTLYHRPPSSTLRKLTFVSPTSLIAGDLVSISSVPGNKYATLKRSGVTSSYLHALSPTSNWISFAPGINKLRVYTLGAPITFGAEFTKKYGGL